jgi:hypothetical protein
MAGKRRMHPNSLANLRPGSHPWQPGVAPRLVHGERTRRPQRSPEWSPAVRLSIADLEGRVGGELLTEDGELQPWAVPSVEAVAVLRVALARAERHVTDLEARGLHKLEHDDLVTRVAERYHRALYREALTLRSRIEAGGQAFDLAKFWAEQGNGDG